MKKLLYFLFCLPLISFAQLTYYDALELSKLNPQNVNGTLIFPLTNGNNVKAYDILRGYAEGANYSQVQNALATNTFINLPPDASASIAVAGLSSNPEILGSIGGLNVSTIADGLAKFLVERAKQELSVAFFDKFEEELDKYEGLRILFPKTHRLLSSIGDEIYNFSAYVNMLREVFQEDLKTIIPNLRTLLESKEIRRYLNINPTIRSILTNALLVAEDLQNGKHPGEVLTNLKLANKDNTALKNFYPSLQLLDLISQSLRSKENERYWVSFDELKALLSNDLAFKIYLGLLYQQGADISFKDGQDNVQDFRPLLGTLGNVSEQFEANKGPLKEYINALATNAQRVDQSLRAIKATNGQEGQKSTYAQHYEFYTASLELLESGMALESIPFLNNIVDFKGFEVKDYFNVAHIAGDLYLDVREKNYFGAVLNLSDILEASVFSNETLKMELVHSIDEAKDIAEDINTANTTEEFAKLGAKLSAYISEHHSYDGWKTFKNLKEHMENLNLVQKPEELRTVTKFIEKMAEEVIKDEAGVLAFLLPYQKELLPKIIKYGNIAASIAGAQSSDEVKNIIEAVALPAGSASIKKRSQCNVALNAYVGLDVGTEKNGDTGDFDLTAGINAPIGVALSWGSYKRLNTNNFKERGSHTAFLSLVDIGAFTSFRFGDSDTEELPEIKIENIFAPGLYYVRGLRKLPISWGLGGQLGPQLRDITGSTMSLENGLSFTLKAFIAVDIPLLNLYTKSR